MAGFALAVAAIGLSSLLLLLFMSEPPLPYPVGFVI